MATSRMLRLAPMLARNFGCVDVAMAAQVGVDRRGLAALAAQGQLVRRFPGVYVSVQHGDGWEQRWMAALLAAGPGAAVSGRAAAYLHDLEQVGARRSRPELELTIPRGRHVRVAGPPVRTAEHLLEEDVVTRGPWRLTSVAWTLCALAHRLGPVRLERALDAAVARGQARIGSVGRTARRFRCCPGMPVIRFVLQRHDPAVRLTRSDAERRLLHAIRDAGLPAPTVAHRVRDRRGRRRELDLAYPDARLMIEVDVHPEHARTIGRNRDGGRQNDLVGDWTPLRFDELDLEYAMGDVIATIRDHLAPTTPDA